MGETDDIFNTTCDAASDVLFTYSGFSMVAMFLVLRSSHRPHSRVHKGVRVRSRGHPHDFGGGVRRMRAFLAEPHSLAAMFPVLSRGLNDTVKKSNKLVV